MKKRIFNKFIGEEHWRDQGTRIGGGAKGVGGGLGERHDLP